MSATDAEALDHIPACLGLWTTDPENNPDALVLADVVGYVQETGRRTDAPEGA